MDIKIPLKRPVIDATIKDIEEGAELHIFTETHDLLVAHHNKEKMEDSTIFCFFINCGKDKEQSLMFDIGIDEIEFLANSILAQVDIIRKNYSEQIKYQTDRFVKV